VLAEEVKALSINEFGTAKNTLTTLSVVTGQLLMDPDKLSSDKFGSLFDRSILGQMSNKRCISLDRFHYPLPLQRFEKTHRLVAGRLYNDVGDHYAYKHGRYSAEAIARRSEISALIRTARALGGKTVV
jgi:hypothetical protein